MKVLVATPVMRGELYLRALLSWYKMDFDGQVDYFQMLGGDYAPHPYDNVVRKFNEARTATLANGYDALMTIESDTIVPVDALKRLAATDADVAYGLYVWRNGFPYWNAYVELDDSHGLPISVIEGAGPDAWGKVIETKGVGNGCTLIKRHVLEELEFTWTPGEFGCCDWHFAIDCQKRGFTQKHDMGVVCGHISVNPVHRILWPDPVAKGLYTAQLLEKWPDFDKPPADKQQTGLDHTNDPEPGSMMKIVVLKHFHIGGGVFHSPGEELEVAVGMGEELLRRHLVKRVGDDEPGFYPKKPCAPCKEEARA